MGQTDDFEAWAGLTSTMEYQSMKRLTNHIKSLRTDILHRQSIHAKIFHLQTVDCVVHGYERWLYPHLLCLRRQQRVS
jgi:hypothetical protein